MSDEQREDRMDHLDGHTEQFKKKITALKELISTMVEEEKETRYQSELLIEMLRVLKAIREFEAETLNAFTAYDSRSRLDPPTNDD